MTQKKKYGSSVSGDSALLSEIVDNLGAGLNLLDRDRRILWANAQMQQWFGDGSIVGSYCYKILHVPESDSTGCPAFYTFQTRKTGSISRWSTTTDGVRRFFQFITTPIFDKNFEVSRVLELVIDLTARKQVEERRIDSERLATIGQLASAVAHELRNPITVIGGFAERLRKKMPENPLVQEATAAILQESRRLEDMVHKADEFLEPGELHLVPCKINDLISKSLKQMDADFRRAGIVVETHLSPEVPPVRADRAKFTQVIFYILQNAVDAMPDGGRLTVSTFLKGDYAEVAIQDTGPGIPDEDADAIFHAFFRRKQAGLGLGLTIASQVVHLHGGYINAEKGTDGRGALFSVGLPVSPSDR